MFYLKHTVIPLKKYSFFFKSSEPNLQWTSNKPLGSDLLIFVGSSHPASILFPSSSLLSVLISSFTFTHIVCSFEIHLKSLLEQFVLDYIHQHFPCLWHPFILWFLRLLFSTLQAMPTTACSRPLQISPCPFLLLIVLLCLQSLPSLVSSPFRSSLASGAETFNVLIILQESNIVWGGGISHACCRNK